jgi:hypothetical protein
MDKMETKNRLLGDEAKVDNKNIIRLDRKNKLVVHLLDRKVRRS